MQTEESGEMTKERVQTFLEANELDAASYDLHEELRNFEAAMEKGLTGEPGGMAMIPTYINGGADVPHNEPVIVLDAGGTNFRVAVLTFDENMNARIENFAKYPMPGSDGEISADEFFNTIVDYVEPVLDASDKIGFCFSYACEITPDKDGKILNFSKEVQVPEAIGKLVGAELNRYLGARGHKSDYRIVILNDTVACLLGGRAEAKHRVYDSNIGFILGTGTNTAYVEDVEHITKLDASRFSEGEQMIINMESGDYRIEHRSALDLEIDASTQSPGQYNFEKLISGRYLGLQALYILRQAIETTDLFSDFFVTNFDAVRDMEAKELNEFLENPYGQNVLARCCSNDIDRRNLYYIIDNVFERAARLVAVNLAGVMRKSGTGKNPVKPTAITVDGTTYYKSGLFRFKLKSYIKTFIGDELGHYCRFLQVDNSNLIGAAIAGLTN